MRHTVVSLFCGCGGKTLGAVQAGFTPVLSVEYDPAIAAVYAENFADPALVADVRDVDYLPFAGADLLMASPVCTRASVANRQGGESELDISCAQAVARAIREICARWFLLENVAQYRKFSAFSLITDALDECGIWWDANVLNAADFGVPQTRTRLIVRGSADGYLPPLPTPTPRKGWYDAVADLLPGCPDTKLADWQVRRLPENFPESALTPVLVPGVPRDFSHEELDLISGERLQLPQLSERPSSPLTASQSRESPRFAETRHPFRAILVEGDAAGDRPPTTLPDSSPAFTIKCAGGGRVHRAIENRRGLPSIENRGGLPSIENRGGLPRMDAYRTVALTTRCLARLQSFPDSFLFPEKRNLAGQCIGNAVPPEMARRIVANLTQR